MNFNEYQLAVDDVRLPAARNVHYAMLGLAGEVGELLSIFAKEIRDGVLPENSEKIKKELGDVLWFVAAIASDSGYTLQTIADSNIEKLRSRRDRGVLQGSGDNR